MKMPPYAQGHPLGEQSVTPPPTPTESGSKVVDLAREVPLTFRLLGRAFSDTFRTLAHGKTGKEDFRFLDIKKIMTVRGTNSPLGLAKTTFFSFYLSVHSRAM